MFFILSNPNLIRELHKEKIIKNNLFTLCLGLNSGYFSVGGINSTLHKENSSITYLNTNGNFFYSIPLNKITLNGKEFNITNEYSLIVDSGSTVTMFPSRIFNLIDDAFNDFCKIPGKCSGKKENIEKEVCFSMNENISTNQLYDSLPSLTFEFEKKYQIEWTPNNYLMEFVDENKIFYCYGFSLSQ